MKNYLPHVFILLLGMGSVIFIWSGTVEKLSKQPIPIVSSEAENIPSEDSYTVDETIGDDEAEQQFPLVRSTENPKRVEGSGFYLTVPADWVVEGYEGSPQNGEYGTISFGQKLEDAFTSDTAVEINLMTFKKPKELRTEIMNRRMVSEDTRIMIVDAMHIEDAKSTLSVKDMILYDEVLKPLNTYPVYRTGFQCLKTCYIEGPPPTRFSYFIDTGDLIYQFDVRTTTSKNTDALVIQAEKIIRSLTLSK